jgi:hypothetical protein
VPGDELVADVKGAVAVARAAMEQDAVEARARGWGSPSPDSASVGMLAAGILIANAIKSAAREREQVRTSRVKRAQTSRSAA